MSVTIAASVATRPIRKRQDSTAGTLTLHELGDVSRKLNGVINGKSLDKQRLIVEDRSQKRKAILVTCLLSRNELGKDWMGSVELQDALGLGCACRVGVGTLADDTFHLEGDGSLGRYRRWSVAESRRDPHTCDLVAETLLQVVKEFLVLARGLLGFGLLVIGRKVEVGVCNVRELEVALFVSSCSESPSVPSWCQLRMT